jgi:dihydroflavonol-4-reductase
MSRVLLTGGTGTVGHAIARELVRRGRQIRALVRAPARARTLLPREVEICEGDVTDPASVRRAMEGCDTVYHASGLPEQWLADPAVFQQVNVEGTRHVVEAALERRVARFLYTSTIDVFVMRPGVEFDESRLDQQPKATHYERSKQDADRLVTAALERGLRARFLHPSAVYGPAPVVTGLNDFLVRLARRQIPMLLPGGMPVVHADDVATGHILAEEAPAGARFILSESYVTLTEIAQVVAAEIPSAKVPAMLPLWVAHGVSAVGELVSRLIRRPPLIPRGQLHFLTHDVRPTARAAREQLGWSPRGFRDGVRAALEALMR